MERPHAVHVQPRPALQLPQQVLGNRVSVGVLRSLGAQCKLAVSTPGDTLEREADRVADAVLAGTPTTGPASVLGQRPSPSIQRMCGGCEEEQPVQHKERPDSAHPAIGVGSALSGLGDFGQPLTRQMRSEFEPRFGRDLGSVRVHADAEAAAAARALGARAFTLGGDIAFGAGEYAPGTREGRHLLAHELTHVVQQQAGSAPGTIQRVTVTIATTGTCADDREIAAALPMARAMTLTAMDWLRSPSPRDRERVNRYLRAWFLSDSEDTRGDVLSVLAGAQDFLLNAQTGRVTFACSGPGDAECTDRPGYVVRGEGAVVHICPAFFDMTTEAQRMTMVHECAHLAGVMGTPEYYFAPFGPVTESTCRGGATIPSTRVALENADSHAWFVWCLTRPRGIEVFPP